MAVTLDIRGDGIHPPDKLEVGKRLARCALKNTYNIEDIVASGPHYAGHEVNGSELIVRFSDTHGGLRSGNRPLFSNVEFSDSNEVKWFEVAGADGEWHKASARIEGDTVVVVSDHESAPVAVRYACHTTPQGSNLYNRAGLPASPFCSDLEMLEWEDHGKE
jgi:sialate O-acetylesterase